MNVSWTPAAEDDLGDIFRYIGRERYSLDAAQRVVQEIRASAADYAAQPLLGAQRPELGEEVRSFRVFRYVVFYRPVEDGIDVLRVIHGARDVERIYRRDQP